MTDLTEFETLVRKIMASDRSPTRAARRMSTALRETYIEAAEAEEKRRRAQTVEVVK